MTAAAAIEVRERPILFSAAMVRAILEGRKTQTRRVILPQPVGAPGKNFCHEPSDPFLCDDGVWRFMCGQVSYDHNDVRCPFGQAGDRLWVRETFYCDDYRYPDGPRAELLAAMYYRADGEVREQFEDTSGPSSWKPSIHMPRWASRIALEITDVRVERIQAITCDDCIAEATDSEAAARHIFTHENVAPWRLAYRDLWNSLNAKRGYAWDLNPWVWVVEFKRFEEATI